jgi:hypothetical protein
VFKLQASVSGSDIEANIKKGVEGREVGAEHLAASGEERSKRIE